MLSELAKVRRFPKKVRDRKIADGGVGPGRGMEVSPTGFDVLLVSPDAVLAGELRRLFGDLGLTLQVMTDVETGMDAMGEPGFGGGIEGLSGIAGEGPGIVLLDSRLPGILSGRLLAAVHESGVHQRCAVALIAERVSDEWIARLREGVIDDIVPRHSDRETWKTHISTMQRGHRLSRELEQLREMSAREVEHDAVTGVLNQEGMLSLLFRETDRVQRLQGTLSLLMIGLDLSGEAYVSLSQGGREDLLRGVTARFSRLLRSYDVLGRMGEDRFLILLPGCSLINTATLVDRIRMTVFGEPFHLAGARGESVEISPAACYAIHSSRGRSPLVVLREAEAALEQARFVGPDAVCRVGEMAGTGSAIARGVDALRDEDMTALYPGAELLV